MPETTTSPEGFIDHIDEPFLRTWALLDYLICHQPSDTPPALAAELAFAYDAYTDHGLHRPDPTVELPLTHLDNGVDLEAALHDLDSLLVEQQAAANADLPLALRVRRTRDQVHHGRTAL